jgi:hypothetical protein
MIIFAQSGAAALQAAQSKGAFVENINIGINPVFRLRSSKSVRRSAQDEE